MKQLEQKRVFWLSGFRLRPGDRANPQSYKVRRAKVGGWRDYFDDEQSRRSTPCSRRAQAAVRLRRRNARPAQGVAQIAVPALSAGAAPGRVGGHSSS